MYGHRRDGRRSIGSVVFNSVRRGPQQPVHLQLVPAKKGADGGEDRALFPLCRVRRVADGLFPVHAPGVDGYALCQLQPDRGLACTAGEELRFHDA